MERGVLRGVYGNKLSGLNSGQKQGLMSLRKERSLQKKLQGGGDPFFNDVRLLTRAGNVGSQIVTDVSTFSNTITAFGDINISSDGFFANSKGIVFDGDGDYLILPSISNFTFDTGDFAVEAFIKPTIVTNIFARTIVGTYYNNGGDFGWLFYLRADGILSFFSGGDGSNPSFSLFGSAAPIADVYNYVAVSRNSGIVTMALNDVIIATAVGTFNENYQRPLKIGTQEAIQSGGNPILGASNTSFIGTIDENIRITRGIARDISIVPTSPFPGS
jgi:hypothetical protein